MTQREAALESMVDWLSDAHELGRPPSKIEVAGELDLHGLRYYLFRYKKSLIGKWLLGVCGGYEGEETEHCGHVYSEMEEYHPATAEQKAVEMVEMLREYWMRRAKELEEQEASSQSGDKAEQESAGGTFLGFVLLGKCAWNPEKLKADLLTDWGVQSAEDDSNEDSLVFEVDGMLAAVSLMPAPVPDGEAEHNAANNYLWPDAVKVVSGHRAHLLVTVLGRSDPLSAGKTFVKLCAACLKQESALGVYASGTVFEPAFYLESAEAVREGELPLLNWIYLGLYRTEGGNSVYTYGMTALGRDEMEVLDSKADLDELRGFLLDISHYVLSSGVQLQDGETIGFSEEQKLPITRSKGVAVEGDSLKIGY